MNDDNPENGIDASREFIDLADPNHPELEINLFRYDEEDDEYYDEYDTYYTNEDIIKLWRNREYLLILDICDEQCIGDCVWVLSYYQSVCYRYGYGLTIWKRQILYIIVH